MALKEAGQYEEALAIFDRIGKTEDAEATKGILLAADYEIAKSLLEEGKLDEAEAAFEKLGNYSDSAEKIQNIVTERTYLEARRLNEKEKLAESYRMFKELGSYKDSQERAVKLASEHLYLADVGDEITIGSYEQDNNPNNGKEPIEWQVLAKEDGKILVISKYGLDCQQYDSGEYDYRFNPKSWIKTWDRCHLHTWLNETFLNNAFSDDEQTKIELTKVSADNDSPNDAISSTPTNDKVFLLSLSEVERYLPSDSSRQCLATAYAGAQGAYTRDGYCCWWLRTTYFGRKSNAACVLSHGTFRIDGDNIIERNNAVRPAMWLDATEIGGYFSFGSYEQDNDLSNGPEPIEWLILDKKDDNVLVCSKYAIDFLEYNTTFPNATWAECSLREWLNGLFLNSAFNLDERGRIITSNISAEKNPKYDTEPGNDTVDNVFLLSISEAEKYFNSANERQCKPTLYAESNDPFKDEKTICCWWLRSPGEKNCAAGVNPDGVVYFGGTGTRGMIGVRPAMWITIE